LGIFFDEDSVAMSCGHQALRGCFDLAVIGAGGDVATAWRSNGRERDAVRACCPAGATIATCSTWGVTAAHHSLPSDQRYFGRSSCGGCGLDPLSRHRFDEGNQWSGERSRKRSAGVSPAGPQASSPARRAGHAPLSRDPCALPLARSPSRGGTPHSQPAGRRRPTSQEGVHRHMRAAGVSPAATERFAVAATPRTLRLARRL
jgi:hypothetical protein